MAEVFDRLSRKLSTEQRRAMLEKIRGAMSDAETPIVAPAADVTPPSHGEQLESLGVWDRLRLWVSRLLTGRTREEILDSWAIRAIIREVQSGAGSAIDLRNRILKEGYARDLARIQISAQRIGRYFDVVRDDRAGFITALAERFFPDIHRSIDDAISDHTIEDLDLSDERALRQKLTVILDEKLGEIDPAVRVVMKMAVVLADRLTWIATFPYGAMLESFDGSAEEENRACVLDYLARPLERLSSLFSDMGDPVDLRVIETLVVYALSDEESGNDELFETTVREAMGSFTDFEEAIRLFVRRYPPTALVRVSRDDPHWQPTVPEVGGDWLSFYRSIFITRISALVTRTTLIRKVTAVLGGLKRTCGARPTALTGLPDGSRGVISRYWYSALILATFGRTLVSGVLGALKILLTNGEFYKASNRAQFNDAYDTFERIPERILEIETRLLPTESWGAVLWNDPSDERIRETVARVDEDLRTYIDTVKTTLEVLVNVLGGVLYARAGSPYDTIANYGQIGGRRNAEFIDELREVHQRLGEVLSYLIDADTLQDRAAEHEVSLPPRRILKDVG